MKRVTGVSFVRTAEGLRVAYAYSVIDDSGNVTESNVRGSYVNTDSATEDFVADIEAKISARLDAK